MVNTCPKKRDMEIFCTNTHLYPMEYIPLDRSRRVDTVGAKNEAIPLGISREIRKFVGGGGEHGVISYKYMSTTYEIYITG